MDLGSVIGLVLVYALVGVAMTLGVGIPAYMDAQSGLLVIGGTTGALLIAFKMETMKNFSKIFMVAIKPPQSDVNGLIKTLVDYASDARRDGILALENKVNNEENEFLKKGLSMAVDGNEPDVIRELLEIETEQTDARHKGNAAIFDQIASLAGAFGMVGTLVGLVAMLVNMSDPAAIGPAMAVALLTTLYGALLGNGFGAPIFNLLMIRNVDEMNERTMVIEGIMSIQAGDNPRVLEQKLLSFLPPLERISQFD
jgi:chemotaxis protein MotA